MPTNVAAIPADRKKEQSLKIAKTVSGQSPAGQMLDTVFVGDKSGTINVDTTTGKGTTNMTLSFELKPHIMSVVKRKDGTYLTLKNTVAKNTVNVSKDMLRSVSDQMTRTFAQYVQTVIPNSVLTVSKCKGIAKLLVDIGLKRDSCKHEFIDIVTDLSSSNTWAIVGEEILYELETHPEFINCEDCRNETKDAELTLCGKLFGLNIYFDNTLAPNTAYFGGRDSIMLVAENTVDIQSEFSEMQTVSFYYDFIKTGNITKLTYGV